MTHELPPLDVRKAMLEEKRSTFRKAGFDAEMEVAALNAQKIEDKPTEAARVKLIEEYRLKAQNCYAAAGEMSRLLTELE